MKKSQSTFLITAVQTHPAYLQPQKNYREIEKTLNKSKGDLIIFPELATSGYNFQSGSDLKKTAEKGTTGRLSQILGAWARKKNAVLVAGFPERSGKTFFNSALIASPKGLSVYRKIHLFNTEKKFFKPGNKPAPVISFKGVKIGVMVCFDWFFPETARGLALKGAQIIAHPSNLVMPYAPEGMKTRSLENGVFSVTVNRVGQEKGLRYIGRSQILGTKGEVLGALGPSRPGVKSVRIDPLKAKNKKISPLNDFMKDRKPGLDG